MKTDMHIQTLTWLNKQIDDIDARGAIIRQMLMEETDIRQIKKLNKQIASLQQELKMINKKIQFERTLINNL